VAEVGGVDPSAEMSSIAANIRRRAPRNARIVFVSGNFNIVHPGHLRLLQFAADCGEYLVVGVNGDTSHGVTVRADMRLEGVRAISIVNYAFLLQEPPEAFIARLQPNLVVKGKEHEDRPNPEQAAVDQYGGKLMFGSGEVRFSSLDLLRREFQETTHSTIRKPPEFPQRHGFRVPDLKPLLSKLRGIRIVVIGDLIVDEYITCDPLGMSQEDPSIVVTPLDSVRFVGGAGIVAAHARGLGAEVRYFGVKGDDDAGRFAEATLQDYGVEADLIADSSRPTTLKQRYRAAGKTLLRVSHLRQHDIGHDIAENLFARVRARLPMADLIIFSDFSYGCLPQYLVDRLVHMAQESGVMGTADSQASSQVGDISRFRNMELITPTEREARLALRDFNAGLVVLADALAKKANARNVVLKLGAEGMLVLAQEGDTYVTDRLPAFNTAPKDTAGAGDSFLACASMALRGGLGLWQSVYLGALAAACQVSRVGNSPLSQADLVTEIDLPS
jgi:rfaE bifunctional protein kinase chain/domain